MSELPKSCAAEKNNLDQVLADYLKAVDAGSPPDRAALLARHPEHRAELEAFLSAQDDVDRWTGPLRELCATPSTVNEQLTVAGDQPGDERGDDETGAAAAQEPHRFGDYELLALIAKGGMGIVYRARQKRLNRVVALKMILAGNLAGAAEVQRFRSEAQAAARLDHPHIVPIYEVGEHDGRHFFIMKLIEGENLAQKVGSGQWTGTTKEGQRRTAALMAKAARAVHYAHQHGILHRDLKPANILLDDHDEPHVTDFGLAKRVDQREEDGTLGPALTQTGAILGTPSYMAPEQAGGDQALTTAVDTYSLGAILFELLTGRPPFRGDTPLDTVLQVRELEAPRPRSLNAAVDYDLETICLKCLEKDPAKRYDSAQALADDLERWLADEPILGRRAGRWERTRKWVRRHPAVSALVGTAGVAAASLLVLGGFLWHNAELRAQAVQDLGEARKNLKAAEDQERAANDNVQRLEEIAAREQARLDELQKLADQERGAAKAARREATHVLYAADMQFAHAAWQAADVPRFRGLLDKHRRPAGAPADDDLRGFEWHYLSRLGGQARFTLDDHAPKQLLRSGQTLVVALSADGKRLASAGGDRKIRIWDADAGKLLDTRNGPPHPVGLAFTPEGDKLRVLAALPKPVSKTPGFFDPKDLFSNKISSGAASVAANLQLEVIDLKGKGGGTPEKLDPANLPASVGLVASGAFGASPRGMVWLNNRLFMPAAFARAPDGKTLALAGFITVVELGAGFPQNTRQKGGVLFWDLENNRQKALQEAHDSIITSAVYSPRGLLATAAFDRTIILWGEDGKPRTTLAGHRAPVMSLAFSADGERLFSGAQDGFIHVWNVATAKLTQTLHGNHAAIINLAAGADGRRLVSAGGDGVVKIWDLETATGAAPLTFPGGVTNLTLADGGQTLVALDRTGMLTTADAATGKVHTRVRVGKAQRFTGFSVVTALSVDGKTLAYPESERPKNKIAIRAAQGGQEFRAFEGVASALAFSPDNRLLAMGRGGVNKEPAVVAVVDLASGQEVLHLKDFTARALKFSSDGKRLAAASIDSKLEIWDVESRQRLLTLGRPEDNKLLPLVTDHQAIAFSADGKLLASGNENTIRLYDALTGKEVLSFPTYSHAVAGIAFSPDGKRLATAGGPGVRLSGGGVKLWDTATGRETISLGDPYGIAGAIAFSPDGTRLAAAVSTEQNILSYITGDGGKTNVHIWETR